jgi:hypothetical protein
MHMQERDVWQYAGDQRLKSGLMADEAIAQRLASPIYRHARRLVEPDVLPDLAVALDRLHAECPDITRQECYGFSHPEINALVCEGRQRTIVGLSSATVNHLDADTLMSVLGPEFGHAAFANLELCAGHRAEDPGVMPAATMRVRAWQRAAEISADRAGLVLAGSLSAAARALCEFSAASGAADAVRSIDAANQSIDGMLATMDPAGASGPLGDPLFADHCFWGGSTWPSEPASRARPSGRGWHRSCRSVRRSTMPSAGPGPTRSGAGSDFWRASAPAAASSAASRSTGSSSDCSAWHPPTEPCTRTKKPASWNWPA